MSTGSHGVTQLDNEHFRVTQWTIEPGGSIPMHRHEHEYVVIPLVTATMRVENADGSVVDFPIVHGVSYSRAAGAEHTISNVDSHEAIVFAEVERL